MRSERKSRDKDVMQEEERGKKSSVRIRRTHGTGRFLVFPCMVSKSIARERGVGGQDGTNLMNVDVQMAAPMTRPMAETMLQKEAMRKVTRLGITPKMNARRAAQDPI